MGLLCLKYRAPSDANFIASEYQYDNEPVDLFSFGCGGSAYPFREIAYMHILGGDDFIGTRKIAKAIDDRRHKDVNNRFQGTLHKVSGPLNRDVVLIYIEKTNGQS